nr:DNA cytosine methyltransferase [uncultured Arsenicibacter sp.]
MKQKTVFLVVDLFCGAGGTTTGFAKAMLDNQQICKTIACVNHDLVAIKSHAANHPETLHFTEDITLMDLSVLTAHVNAMRKRYPDAKLLLWASLECTNFSNAKGGKPRDADSRSLADHMPRYIEAINPDYFMIENVREFMSWGPLVAKTDLKHKFDGHKAPACHLVLNKKTGVYEPYFIPESRDKGKDYQRWIRQITDMGFNFEYKLLNAADYGAYTSRLRYFAIFARPGLPIRWPAATHAKKVSDGIFGGLRPWMPVRDVLELDKEGDSIFLRDKPYSEKTLERIYAGLIKHVAGGEDAFLQVYNSGSPNNRVRSLEEPSFTLTTENTCALVSTVQPKDGGFLVKYMGNNPTTGINNGKSLNEPCNVITTQDRISLVQTQFLSKQYSGQPQHKNIGIDGPAGTMTTTDSHALVSANFITRTNGGQAKDRIEDVEQPIGTITTAPNRSVVSAKFIVQRQNDVPGRNPAGRVVSIDGPARTITTTGGNQELVQPVFLDQQFGNSEPASIDQPAGSLTANPKFNLVQSSFMTNYYSGGAQTESVNGPTTSLVTIPKQRLVQCILTNQHNNTPRSLDEPSPTLLTGNHHYILNAQFEHTIQSVDTAHPTITADRHYSYLVVLESGQLAIRIFDTDSPMTVKIKEFMGLYGMVDIKMRMLLISELKRIQGFDDEYVLLGTMTAQKKFIGNSVVPVIPQRMAECIGEFLTVPSAELAD